MCKIHENKDAPKTKGLFGNSIIRSDKIQLAVLPKAKAERRA
jgi:hypothetical protein